VLEDKLRRENRAIVPMSLALGSEERLLVISGPIHLAGKDRGAEGDGNRGAFGAGGDSGGGASGGTAAV